jgi:hypothetical protein
MLFMFALQRSERSLSTLSVLERYIPHILDDESPYNVSLVRLVSIFLRIARRDEDNLGVLLGL